MNLSGALILLAMSILVIGPSLGLIFFRPDRARSVKVAETKPKNVALHYNQALVYYPEVIKRYRLDRHVTYVCLHIGLFMYGAGVILSPAPNTNLTGLSFDTQQSLGLNLLIGSSMVLAGSTLGASIGRCRKIMHSVSDNPLSPILGDDIRFPYTVACAGLLSIGVSMGFYIWTLIGSAPSKVLGTLGGGVSVGIGLMCLILVPELIWRIRQYNDAYDLLLTEANKRSEANDAGQ